MKIKERKIPSRTREIITDYNSGMLMVDMVAKYRISSSRIYKIIKPFKDNAVDNVDNS